jgi:serine phosphatase RsbU (regulator of sigma subunit)
MVSAFNSRINKLFKNSKTTKRVVVLVFVAILAMSGFYIYASYKFFCEQTLKKLDAISKTVSLQINGNLHSELLNKYQKKDDIKSNNQDSIYYNIHLILKRAQVTNNLKTELSTLIFDDSSKAFYYVVNSIEAPYYLDPYKSTDSSFYNLYEEGGILPIYHDEYGTWLSAINPIKDSSGKVVAVVEVDERYDDFIDVISGDLLKELAFALLVFFLIAFILLRYLRIILLGEEEIKKELEHSYEIINQHNEDILNSINYAKKIQFAILPPLEIIKKNLPSSFVFYKPKDIVSGDFYFFREIVPNEKFIIAACDCTGHGVPGALMSVIGNNFLEHIINNGVYSPSMILTQLNQSVINTLKQDAESSESKDGMDIALCLIDKTNNSVSYSGANRPLYILNSFGECTEIKGDKRPIGGLDNRHYEFTEHQLSLNTNESYYLFSDGYVDQFGGEKNKKFSSKRFKEMLSALANRPLNSQYHEIENTFENWKQSNSQTDDVLVIGFKID